MKIVFFGTPTFASDFLSRLAQENDFDIVAVVTQPDEPVGRKQTLTPPPVKTIAEKLGIPVWQPARVKDNGTLFETLRSYSADVFVVVAYGRILPQALLDIPARGVVNVHPSLLPLYRGPTPMQAAIRDGATTTGISIIKLDALMDHGPLFAQKEIALDADETTETLTRKVVDIGVPLLIHVLHGIAEGALIPVEQKHERATTCGLLTREDGIIDWNKPAEEIERMIRAFTPWPGTSTDSLKIFFASVTHELLSPGVARIAGDKLLIGTGTTALEIHELQPSGRKRMNASTFIHGNRHIDGILLTQKPT